MKKFPLPYYLSFVLLVVSFYGIAQTESPKESIVEEGIKLGVGLSIGHTWVPTGENFKGERDYIVVPSWGLDFIAELNENWGVVLANEIQIQRFLVKTSNENVIERDYPFTSVLEITYRTAIGLGFFLGPGIELEPHKNFFVYRFGAEYAIPFKHHWFVKPAIAYEMKELEYSILNIGLGIGFLR